MGGSGNQAGCTDKYRNQHNCSTFDLTHAAFASINPEAVIRNYLAAQLITKYEHC